MRVPRFTIQGLLIAVAVIAVDFTLIVEVFTGVLLPAIGLNVGLFQIFRREGRARRFWLGFEVAGLLMLGVYVRLLAIMDEVAIDWPLTVYHFLIDRMTLTPDARGFVSDFLSRYLGAIGLIVVVFEVTVGMPLLLLSALVGWVVSRVAPGPPTSPGPVESSIPSPGASEAGSAPTRWIPKARASQGPP